MLLHWLSSLVISKFPGWRYLYLMSYWKFTKMANPCDHGRISPVSRLYPAAALWISRFGICCCMLKVCNSNPPVVTGINDLNRSKVRYHPKFEFSPRFKCLHLDTSPSLHPDTWYFQILAPPSLHKLVFLSRRTFEYLSLSLALC